MKLERKPTGKDITRKVKNETRHLETGHGVIYELLHKKTTTLSLERSIEKTPLTGDPEKNSLMLGLIEDYRTKEQRLIEQCRDAGMSEKEIEKLLRAADKKTQSE